MVLTVRRGVGQASSSGGLPYRILTTTAEIANYFGISPRAGSLQEALQLCANAERDARAFYGNLIWLGARNAVTASDVARWNATRWNLFTAQQSLYIEVVAATRGRIDVPAPVPFPAYSGPVNTAVSGGTGDPQVYIRRGPQSGGGLSGLGRMRMRGLGAAAPIPPIPPLVLWAGVIIAIAAIVAFVVIVRSSQDTIYNVWVALISSARDRVTSAQRVSAVQGCYDRGLTGATLRSCVNDSMGAVLISAPIGLRDPDTIPWYVWLGGLALAGGGLYLAGRYFGFIGKGGKGGGFFGLGGGSVAKDDEGGPRPTGSLVIGGGKGKKYRRLPASSANRKDRYNEGELEV